MTSAPIAQLEQCTLTRTDEGIQVTATVRNLTDHPVFVTSELRRLELDAAQRTATLWFSDVGRDLATREPGIRHYTVPRTEAIEPSDQYTVTAELPAKLNRLVIHDDESFDVEALDMTLTDRAVLHVTVADEPFYFNPKGRTLLEQLDRWGEVIDGEAEAQSEPPASRGS